MRDFYDKRVTFGIKPKI